MRKRTRLAGLSRFTAREVYLSRAPDDSAEQQRIETSFFAPLKLRNGTFKTTGERRLDDLNELVTTLLPRDHPLEILDTAVSSGITTVEWCEHLRKAGVPFRMSAGDLFSRAELLSWGRHFHVLVDDTGCVLQYETGGLAWRTWTSRGDWLSLYAAALPVTQLLFRLLKSVKAPARRPLQLFSPRLLATGIELFEDDIFEMNEAFAQRFDVIRAVNILNIAYFPRKQLEVAIACLAARLKPDGLLIVNRTDDSRMNHGSVFRLTTERKFRVEGQIGDGSEIEDVVLAFQP